MILPSTFHVSEVLESGTKGSESELEDVRAPALPRRSPIRLGGFFIARSGSACAHFCDGVDCIQN